MDRTIDAESGEKACEIAVQEENASDEPAQLGLILEVTQLVEGTDILLHAHRERMQKRWCMGGRMTHFHDFHGEQR